MYVITFICILCSRGNLHNIVCYLGQIHPRVDEIRRRRSGLKMMFMCYARYRYATGHYIFIIFIEKLQEL